MDVVLSILSRSLALLVVTGLTALVLRRRAASVRAMALTAGLVGLLALPILSMALPAWRVPMLRASNVLPVDVRDVSAVLRMPAPRTSVNRLVASVARPEATLGSEAIADRPLASTSDVGAISPSPSAWLMSPGALLAIWFVGCGALLVRLSANHRALARLIRRSDPADSAWQDLVAEVSTDLRLGRSVPARINAEIDVPLVAGVMAPVLILPEEASDWPIPVRRAVLRHELAHVVRRDALGQLAGQAACALYWFNPLVWVAAARASILRERACDDVVIRGGARASDYASWLLDLARGGGHSTPASAALAMARASRLRERIIGVLEPGVRREGVGGRTAVALLAGAIATVVTLGVVEPTVRAEGRAATVGVEMAAAQTATPPAFCATNLTTHSSSMSEHNGERSWKMKIAGPTCRIDLDSEGQLEFNDTFTDLARVGRGGYFTLDVVDGGTRRALDIRNSSSGLTHTFKLNGRDHAWDATAQAWFADMLIQLDRRTAIGVDIRLPRLLSQGGPAAVFRETGLVTSDFARGRYYSKLLDARRLTTDERRQLLEQAAGLTASDFYASELLKKIVTQGGLEDARERAAVLAMIQKMDSDFYRSETISTLVDRPIGPEQMSALLQVARSLTSDFYRAEVLKRLMSAGRLDSAQRALALGVVSDMDSDFYAAEILKQMTSAGIGAPEERKIYLASVSRMDSDFYKREALGAWTSKADLGEADLLGVIEVVRGMGSDFYQTEILLGVLQNRGANERVKQAVRDLAERMSNSYRRRLLDAARN